MFRRPEITGNNAFDSGGLRFEVMRPFDELHASYTGPVALLDDPLVMADPGEAFESSPHADCAVEVTFTGRSTMFCGDPTEGFAEGHYEQLTAGAGSVAVGQDRWEVDGFGLRDHSWGPRSWQAPWYSRRLTANFGAGFGFMGSCVVMRDREGHRGGFVWDGTALHGCQGLTLTTTTAGADSYHDTIDCVLSAGDRQWHARGRVLSLIPLRNRRDGQLTRISEGMTEWTLDDGRIGYGMSEYLDQMVDGKPVGLGE
jgi:hypothetical protein